MAPPSPPSPMSPLSPGEIPNDALYNDTLDLKNEQNKSNSQYDLNNEFNSINLNSNEQIELNSKPNTYISTQQPIYSSYSETEFTHISNPVSQDIKENNFQSASFPDQYKLNGNKNNSSPKSNLFGNISNHSNLNSIESPIKKNIFYPALRSSYLVLSEPYTVIQDALEELHFHSQICTSNFEMRTFIKFLKRAYEQKDQFLIVYLDHSVKEEAIQRVANELWEYCCSTGISSNISNSSNTSNKDLESISNKQNSNENFSSNYYIKATDELEIDLLKRYVLLCVDVLDESRLNWLRNEFLYSKNSSNKDDFGLFVCGFKEMNGDIVQQFISGLISQDVSIDTSLKELDKIVWRSSLRSGSTSGLTIVSNPIREEDLDDFLLWMHEKKRLVREKLEGTLDSPTRNYNSPIQSQSPFDTKKNDRTPQKSSFNINDVVVPISLLQKYTYEMANLNPFDSPSSSKRNTPSTPIDYSPRNSTQSENLSPFHSNKKIDSQETYHGFVTRHSFSPLPITTWDYRKLKAEVKNKLIHATRVTCVTLYSELGSHREQIAIDIYNDYDIRKNFSNGIYFINCSKETRPIEILFQMRKLCQNIDPNQVSFIHSIASGNSILAKLLKGKKVLLVLSEVYCYDQIEAFFMNEESGVKYLVTSNYSDICKEYPRSKIHEVVSYEVSNLNMEECTNLIYNNGNTLFFDKSVIVSLCDYFHGQYASIQLLSILLQNGDSPSHIIDYVENMSDMSEFDKKDPQQKQYWRIFALFQYVIDNYISSFRQQILVLSAFPEGVNIPLSVLQLVWNDSSYEITKDKAIQISNLGFIKIINEDYSMIRIPDIVSLWIKILTKSSRLEYHKKVLDSFSVFCPRKGSTIESKGKSNQINDKQISISSNQKIQNLQDRFESIENEYSSDFTPLSARGRRYDFLISENVDYSPLSNESQEIDQVSRIAQSTLKVKIPSPSVSHTSRTQSSRLSTQRSYSPSKPNQRASSPQNLYRVIKKPESPRNSRTSQSPQSPRHARTPRTTSSTSISNPKTTTRALSPRSPTSRSSSPITSPRNILSPRTSRSSTSSKSYYTPTLQTSESRGVISRSVPKSDLQNHLQSIDVPNTLHSKINLNTTVNSSRLESPHSSRKSISSRFIQATPKRKTIRSKDIILWQYIDLSKLNDLESETLDYFFRYLTYHLHNNAQHDTIRRLVTSYEWIFRKCNTVKEIGEILLDFERLCQVGEEGTYHILSPEIQYKLSPSHIAILYQALRDSLPILIQNKSELPFQLLGRLVYLKGHIKKFLQEIVQFHKKRNDVWLNPFVAYNTGIHPSGRPVRLSNIDLSRSIIGSLNSLHITPDSDSILFLGRDSQVHIFNISESRQEREIPVSSDWSFDVTPCGKYIIAATYDRVLRKIDLKTGAEVLTFVKENCRMISFLKISPDGKFVFVYSTKQIIIWLVEKGNIHRIIDLEYKLTAIEWDYTSQYLFIATENASIMRVRSYSGQEETYYPLPFEKKQYSTWVSCFAQDKENLFSAFPYDNIITQHSIRSGRCIKSIMCFNPFSIAIASKFLVIGSQFGDLHVRNLNTEAKIAEYQILDGESLLVQITPDEQFIVVYPTPSQRAMKVIKLIDMRILTSTNVDSITYDDENTEFAVTKIFSKGNAIVPITIKPTLIPHKLDTGRELDVWKIGYGLKAVAPDVSFIACLPRYQRNNEVNNTSENDSIEIDSEYSKITHSTEISHSNEPNVIMNEKLSSRILNNINDEVILSSTKKEIQKEPTSSQVEIWDLRNLGEFPNYEYKFNNISQIVISASNDLVLFQQSTNRILVVESKTGQIKREIDHDYPIQTISTNTDFDHLIVSYKKGFIRIYSLNYNFDLVCEIMPEIPVSTTDVQLIDKQHLYICNESSIDYWELEQVDSEVITLEYNNDTEDKLYLKNDIKSNDELSTNRISNQINNTNGLNTTGLIQNSTLKTSSPRNSSTLRALSLVQKKFQKNTESSNELLASQILPHLQSSLIDNSLSKYNTSSLTISNSNQILATDENLIYHKNIPNKLWSSTFIHTYHDTNYNFEISCFSVSQSNNLLICGTRNNLLLIYDLKDVEHVKQMVHLISTPSSISIKLPYVIVGDVEGNVSFYKYMSNSLIEEDTPEIEHN